MAPPIERADVQAMLETQVAPEVLSAATAASAVLSTFRTFNMGTRTARIPVQDALATAGFVTEGSAKPETEVTWDGVDLVAEEIAAIAVVHENVLADPRDSGFDLWALIRPQIATGIAKVIDGAAFFGTNIPTSWGTGIVPAAVAAGNVTEQGTATAAQGGIAGDLSATMGQVETDGYDPNRWYTGRSMRGMLRDVRATDGTPLYISTMRSDGSTDGEIFGLPQTIIRNGAWPAKTVATAVVGDTSTAIVGLRSDLTFRIFDTGTVGSISRLEKDMLALRCTMRVAFAVAKPLMPDGTAGGYPFAVLRDAT